MAPALNVLTEAQAAVYDRQLRVWGVEVQRRLMEAKVLVIGLGGLGAEIAKNIVLAGVGTVGLRDGNLATSAAPGNFLVEPQSAAGKSVAAASAATLQAMNPLMTVRVEPGPPNVAPLLQPPPAAETGACSGETMEDPKGADALRSLVAEYDTLRNLVSSYDTVVACGLSLRELAALDDLCRTLGKQLFAGSVRGASSFVFVDLGPTHEHTVKGQGGEQVAKALSYSTFREAMAADLATSVNKRTHPLYLVLRACWEFEREAARPAAGPADVAAVQAVAERLAAATGPARAAESPAAAAAALLPAGLLEGFVVDAPACAAATTSVQDPGQEGGQGVGAGGLDGEQSGMAATGGPAASLEELAPVCAVVGGVVANNVLRAISHVQTPLRNLFLYSYAVRDGLGVEEYFAA